MNRVVLFSLLSFGLLLIWLLQDLPQWGDPNAPASQYISPYYIKHTIKDTNVPNIVSSILADYRGIDTLLETTVAFVAGLSIILILRRFKREITADKERFLAPIPSLSSNNMILQITVSLLLPAVHVFALYVLIHGHDSPGGGFQGGVIFGAGLIMVALAFSARKVTYFIEERMNSIVASFGLLVYAGVGLLAVILGGRFLDYGHLSVLFGSSPSMARSYGILLVEIGVFFVVSMVMYSIYFDLSTRSEFEESEDE